MENTSNPWAIVVGAGPSGLLLGLMLAKQGIPVQIVDLASKLDEQPRATHYNPPAVHELRRAGVADDARKEGFTPKVLCWRKLDGTHIAGLDGTVMDDSPNKRICLPLDKLGKVLYRHVQKQPSAKVSWNHKVTKIGQDETKAWIDVDTPEGSKRLEAQYIIGCDGGNSQIRRSLFGDKQFPGKTWDEQIVATNVSSLLVTFLDSF